MHRHSSSSRAGSGGPWRPHRRTKAVDLLELKLCCRDQVTWRKVTPPRHGMAPNRYHWKTCQLCFCQATIRIWSTCLGRRLCCRLSHSGRGRSPRFSGGACPLPQAQYWQSTALGMLWSESSCPDCGAFGSSTEVVEGYHHERVLHRLASTGDDDDILGIKMPQIGFN